MNTQEITTSPAGFLETVKDKVNYNQVVEKVQSSQGMLIEIALYGTIGFLSGFLIKRYSTLMIMLVLFVTGLVVLHQMDIVNVAVNWTKLNEIVGLPISNSLITDNMPMLFIEWAKSNMVIVVSIIIGFLIGLKVG